MSTNVFPEAPSPDNFLRRAFHSSVVLGDHVFIDGGEIIQQFKGDVVKATTNVTLTLDLRHSWTNDEVSFDTIERRGPPTLNQQVLWPTTDNSSFFIFGGEKGFITGSPRPPVIQVWEFLRDGQNGSWTNLEPNGFSGFTNLTRPDGALGATLHNTGYILGGFENKHSNPEITADGDDISIPGIVTFNMTSGRWTNTSAPDNLIRRSGKNGILAAVPSFGPNGLLLATGTGSNRDGPLPFDNITIYEPGNQTWHYQTATGDIPDGRDKACSVGIQSDNGTFEVFVYGGQSNDFDGKYTPAQVDQNVKLDSVYVLSLPAFVWFKADYTPRCNRNRHTCHVVGNSQMLSIGGLDATYVNNASKLVDPIPQGLEIFDLTKMTWSNRYDANAAPYKSPQVVKDFYARSGTSSVEWNDPAVQRFFEKSTDTDTDTSSSKASSATDPSSSSPSTRSVNGGTIAGAVLGGVIALCLVFGIVLWLRRRRKTSNLSQLNDAESSNHIGREATTASNNGIMQEMPDHCIPYEADSRARLELESRGRRELFAESTIPRSELHNSSRDGR